MPRPLLTTFVVRESVSTSTECRLWKNSTSGAVLESPSSCAARRRPFNAKNNSAFIRYLCCFQIFGDKIWDWANTTEFVRRFGHLRKSVSYTDVNRKDERHGNTPIKAFCALSSSAHQILRSYFPSLQNGKYLRLPHRIDVTLGQLLKMDKPDRMAFMEQAAHHHPPAASAPRKMPRRSPPPNPNPNPSPSREPSGTMKTPCQSVARS